MYVLMDATVFCASEIDHKLILASSIYKLTVEAKKLWVRKVDQLLLK